MNHDGDVSGYALIATESTLIRVAGTRAQLVPLPDTSAGPMLVACTRHHIWFCRAGGIWCGDGRADGWRRVDPWPADRTRTGRAPELDFNFQRIRHRNPDARVTCARSVKGVACDHADRAYVVFAESCWIEGGDTREAAMFQPGLVRCQVSAAGEARLELRAEEVFFTPLWDEFLDDVLVTRSGQIWLAGSCAFRLDLEEGWYASYRGDFEVSVLSVAESPQGRLLFGTQEGIRLLDPDSCACRAEERRLSLSNVALRGRSLQFTALYEVASVVGRTDTMPWVTRIAVSPTGAIWGALPHHGLLLLERDRCLCAPLFRQNGRPWGRGPAVAFCGAFADCADLVLPFSPRGATAMPSRINEVRCDGRGRTWVGSNGGLAVWDGAAWWPYAGSIGGVALGAVRGIAIAGDGPTPLPSPTWSGREIR